jgi:hypothetical protein
MVKAGILQEAPLIKIDAKDLHRENAREAPFLV